MKVYVVSLRTESGDDFPAWKVLKDPPEEREILESIVSAMPHEFLHKETFEAFNPNINNMEDINQFDSYVSFIISEKELE